MPLLRLEWITSITIVRCSLSAPGTYYYYGASYGLCEEPLGSNGCANVSVGACGFRLDHNVSLYTSKDMRYARAHTHTHTQCMRSAVQTQTHCHRRTHSLAQSLTHTPH